MVEEMHLANPDSTSFRKDWGKSNVISLKMMSHLGTNRIPMYI